ncbi:hypothetical protein Btru_067836 [Bulinus truncatus]|nr:hypothetical protein Btru_067836 [Bulinus truncatus]
MDNFSKVLYFLCLLKCLILTLYTVSACEPGWFGDSCSYMCHCVTTCDQTGECTGTNNTCVRGWFGYKCQYQDLLTLPTLTVVSSLNHTLDEISDRDDTTCLSSNSSVRNLTFKWNTPYVFTWLRLVVDNENLLTSFSIEFGKDTQKLTCNNRRLYLINNLTLDIRCDVYDIINQITVTGLGLPSLCSLYINGGRNIALKQQTSMSSVYENFTSSKAVDGNTDDSRVWRLNGFMLIAQLENVTVLSHSDKYEKSVKRTYTILDESTKKISSVNIYGNKSKDVLHFCEVEIFGECAAGTWGLNCTKCPSRCPLTCNVDNGRCSTVCYGHSNPPNCTQECRVSKWGHNCENTCSAKCIGRTCNTVTGLCDANCNGLSCPSDCPQGFYGENCTLECSSTCKDFTCSDYGYCVSCLPGLEGNFCKNADKVISFEEGIDSGFAASAACSIIVFVVVIVVCERRNETTRDSKRPITEEKTKGREENLKKKKNDEKEQQKETMMRNAN